VTYQDGRESYKNIKVGNKSTDKPMDQIEARARRANFDAAPTVA